MSRSLTFQKELPTRVNAVKGSINLYRGELGIYRDLGGAGCARRWQRC